MDKEDRREVMKFLSEIIKGMNQLSYKQLDKINMYPGQPQLLILIRDNIGITQKALAEKNLTKPATITGMLKKLEMNDYIQRVSDEKDSRVMRVYLTPKGRALTKACEEHIDALHEKLFADFTKEETDQYKKILIKITNNLRKS